MTGVIIKPGPQMPAVVKMVIPGRRTYGEDWVEVTIRPTPEGSFSMEREMAERPAQGRPVVIPAMANLSDEEVNHILGGALKAQDYYSRQNRRPSQAEINKEVNAMWQDYMAQKLAWMKGQTVSGPAQFSQREKPGRTHWTGVEKMQ